MRHIVGLVSRGAWRAYSWRFNRRIDREYLMRERYAHPLAFRTSVADPRFCASMARYARHLHREWLYDLREASYLEPRRGFVLGPRGQVLTNPFNYHRLLEEAPSRAAISLIAGRNGSIPRLDTAVSLRCVGEGNYWHFFDDLLSKLRLVDELDLPKDVPLLVGSRVWRQPFFAQAIARGRLRERNWVEHTSMLEIQRLVIPVPMSLQKANLEYALQMLDPPTPRPSGRRIFLNRGPRRERLLLNFPDLRDVLAGFDFEIVDTDEMSLAQQMELFSQARMVVANHGAGLANLLFRIGQPLELVELFAPDFISPHFVWLAHAFGFGYDAVVGAPAGHGHFRIDLDELRAVITRTVTHIEERGVAPTRGEKSTGCPPHFEGRGACVPRTPGGGNARGMY